MYQATRIQNLVFIGCPMYTAHCRFYRWNQVQECYPHTLGSSKNALNLVDLISKKGVPQVPSDKPSSSKEVLSNLLSFLFRCGYRPYELGQPMRFDTLMKVSLSSLLAITPPPAFRRGLEPQRLKEHQSQCA